MEMRDPSAEEIQKTVEQTPDQAAPEQAAVDTETPAETPVEDPEATVEEEVTEAVEEETIAKPADKAALIDELRAMLTKDGAEIQRAALVRVRQAFNALRKVEIEAERDGWVADGNPPEAFILADDPAEKEFNDLLEQVREKKNAWAAAQEVQRQQNLEQKNAIIAQIIALAEDTDNVNRTFPLYRELQDRFNAIGEVPPTDETDVWKRFQEARERYSDNLKINKELRDYDFQKNLESKELLIKEAEALDTETDVITAFRRLQVLHDRWREIGPVDKDKREEIWTRFKDASANINKKYQQYFEERKKRETENEQAKNALCERIEALDFSSLSSFMQWEEMTTRIKALQDEWKNLGFASRKVNNALYNRFRQRCDEFFTAKAAYFKSVKEEYADNLAKKMELVERAEALKDSTDWRKATDQFVAMQKEWKTIGAVNKKHSDTVWKRFLTACDTFFDRKKQATSGQRTTEQTNLKTKREIIAALQALIDDSSADDAPDRLRQLQEQWQQTGHVPFKEKDKINDSYREAVNTLRRRLGSQERAVRLDRFEADMAQIEGDQTKLLRERERLVRALEGRRADIRTYENNLGFLSSKSKSGENMVMEFRRKIERLKEDITSIEDKIRIIDEKLS